MRKLFIRDETAKLKSVILGIGESLGGVPTLEEAYDPKSKENIINGTYPKEEDMIREFDGFQEVLERHGVEVLRPEVLENLNQVFVRDIGFVIEDKFFISNMLKDRSREILGIQHLLDQVGKENIVHIPPGIRIEGGDVLPWGDKLFVGYSEQDDFQKYKVARTNMAGVEFLRDYFPAKEVLGCDLIKSDTDPKNDVLHFDCCFQPIGHDECIIYRGAFKHQSDLEKLTSIFGETRMIDITKEEMYEMNSNVFSISPGVIVSEKSFSRLNETLRSRGYTVEEVTYKEIPKMGGLFRCTTLPLERV